MVSRVTDGGGREHKRLSFSKTKPDEDLGKEGIPLLRAEEVALRSHSGGFLSLHWPDFLPKLAEPRSPLGLNEKGLRSRSGFSLGLLTMSEGGPVCRLVVDLCLAQVTWMAWI